jgi:hypothetical protein
MTGLIPYGWDTGAWREENGQIIDRRVRAST